MWALFMYVIPHHVQCNISSSPVHLTCSRNSTIWGSMSGESHSFSAEFIRLFFDWVLSFSHSVFHTLCHLDKENLLSPWIPLLAGVFHECSIFFCSCCFPGTRYQSFSPICKVLEIFSFSCVWTEVLLGVTSWNPSKFHPDRWFNNQVSYSVPIVFLAWNIHSTNTLTKL